MNNGVKSSHAERFRTPNPGRDMVNIVTRRLLYTAAVAGWLAGTAVLRLFAAPVVDATKVDVLLIDNDANGVPSPGDVLEYILVVTNSGDMTATGVVVEDPIPSNTTLVGGPFSTPLARDDLYTTSNSGAFMVSAALGVSTNDNDPDGDPITIVAYDTAGSMGGVIALNTNDGSFVYTPPGPPGVFSGTDTWSYVVSDPSNNLDSATVTIVVQASMANTPPTPMNDAYLATGNIGLNVPASAGVTNNDTDAEGDLLTVTPFNGATTMGGTVNLLADGSFTYTPAVAFNGADSFTYQVSDGQATSNATVTLTVSDMVWFIDKSAGAAGVGTLASPFDSLAAFNGAGADSAGEVIYVYHGGGGIAGLDAGITLDNNQTLLGEGVALDAANSGITFPSHTPTLPSAGSRPTLGRTAAGTAVELGSGNTIRGLALSAATGKGINGSGFGTLTVSATDVTATGGIALDLNNGTLAASFDTLTSALSPAEGIDLDSCGGTLSITTTTINSTVGDGIDAANCGGGNFNFGTAALGQVVAIGQNGIDIATGNAGATF
ncbi:MAG: tandem-95 repeat protein, partial [Verrucomicrobiota bacterium]